MSVTATFACPGAHAQQGPFVYIPTFLSNNLSTIDSSTNSVGPGTIALGNQPLGAVVRGDEAFVYLTNNSDNSVSVVDTGTNTVVATVAVGSSPIGAAITPDGKAVYVANRGSNSTSVITTASNTVTTTISVGTGPFGLAVSPDGKNLYVANSASNTISIIGTASNTVIATVPVGANPGGVAVTPDGKFVYVANSGSNSISVIATATNTVATTFGVGSAPNFLAITPDGKQAYVANFNSNSVSIIDTATNTVRATVPVGNGPYSVAISPDGKSAYVTNSSSDTVSLIDTATNTVGLVLPLGAVPAVAAICANGNALLASGLTFVAHTSGALACTLASGPAGSPGPVFTGGTLQIAGSGIASALPIILLAGGGTLDTNGNNATLSGSISGPGGLTKIGAGRLTLSGSGSYSGATSVNAGTLQAGAANAFSPNSAYTVAAGAVLDLASFNQVIGSLAGAGSVTLGSATLAAGNDNTSTTFSGAISGSGGLTKIGTGTLTLAGRNTYTGATLVSAGKLQAGGSGAFPNASAFTVGAGGVIDLNSFGQLIASLAGAGNVALGSATLTTGNDGTSTTFSGAMSGTGGLTKMGFGAFTMTGANTYTGPTAVNGGILTVNGSLASVVSVNNGSTLMGNGTIGGLNIASGGIVAPGNSIGTLNVSGNVAFAAGSIYQVEINAAGQGDKIAATAKATLAGGTVQVQAAAGTYSPALRYTILTANGGVAGTFAQRATSANLAFAFLTPALSYDANDVFLGFTQTTTLPSLALTRNQLATATAIQALGFGNPVFNAVVAQNSAAGARQAFDALSGEIHASAVTAAFEDQRLPREAILDRLSQPAAAPLLGAATTMTGAYAADLPSRKGPALAPVDVQMYRPRLYGLWGQGFGDWGRTGSDHNAAKLSRDTGGFIIGADAERHLFNGDWRFGIAGGYTDDSLKVSARNSSGDYQSIFGALYGKASFGAIDLKAGAILASTDTHTSRSIIFPGFADAASSSYGGTAAQGFGEIGYRLPFHWTVWSYVPWLSSLSVNYEPFLQGAIIHIDQNRYVETALAAGFVGAARGYDLGTTTLGLRTEYKLASAPAFTLRTMLGWRHAFGDVRPSVTQSFAGAFNSFNVAGVPIDRDALASEATLDYAVSSMVTVGASYSSQTGRRASDNAFKGRVDVSF